MRIFKKNSYFKPEIPKNKSTFIKLLASYLVIIFVVLCISSLVFFSNYKKLVLNEGYNVSKRSLDQAKYYTELNLNWAKSLVYSLYLDDKIYTLMYSSSPITDNSIIARLREINASSPNIDSICVYNKATNILYSSLGTGFNPEYEKSMRDLLINTKDTFSGNPIPLKIDIISKEGNIVSKNIFSIVLSNLPASGDKLPNGAIILNVNADVFSNYFKQTNKNDNILFSIDNTGRIVFSADSRKFLSDISKESYINDILASPLSSGSFISTINDVQYFVAYSNYKNQNLNFINLVPYELLIGQSKKARNSSIIIVLLLLFIGVIISYIISHKFYDPIEKLIKSINEKLPPENLKGYKNRNELEYLSEALDQVLSQPTSLENLPLEEMVFIRNKLLKDILVNNQSMDINKYPIKLQQLNLNIDLENILVVIFRIDSVNTLYKKYPIHNDRNLIRLGIKNIIVDNLSQQYKVDTLIIANSIVAVLSIGREIDENTKNELLNFIRTIQDKIYDKSNISLSASMGPFVSRIDELSTSYKKANEYINYTFKYGHRATLYESKILQNISKEYKYDEILENALFDAIKLGNKEKIRYCLDKIFENILQYSYNDIILSITTLAINSRNLINTLFDVNNEKCKIYVTDFLEHLKDYELAEDVKLWFLNLYESYIDTLNEKKLSKNNVLVEKVKEYIVDNYSDFCLSVEQISESLDMSPNYLRTIFKNVTGESISKYINDYRFNKAKSLLTDTDHPIADISTMVGYANSNYFYTAFRKNYGVSPAQFRKNNRTK
ncbi:HTH-type transcriptional regulator YesS [Clostridium homopropionicum DSM 5847]|uniref:HTH-type transcriptional regulator YesS n=1 Tax=Clostridium homopropionicum DSM 5847 TaxID=1121318 RepID=A0A0L6Z848_9CLOT|nr:AraC family transcriptional regulator [Clostridium homopropionicum]KOA19146.1 HTH-type transcriptional regulator YesS [Clostridium homopropionicum DSM 5847]SFG15580.1 transcriptional regulator, AraC family [Clostridium homopropionicum]